MSVLGQHTDPMDSTATLTEHPGTLDLFTHMHTRISTAVRQPQSVSWTEYKPMISLIGHPLES